jgi:hypothetical protein
MRNRWLIASCMQDHDRKALRVDYWNPGHPYVATRRFVSPIRFLVHGNQVLVYDTCREAPRCLIVEHIYNAKIVPAHEILAPHAITTLHAWTTKGFVVDLLDV